MLAATRVCLLSADQIHTAMQLGDEVGRMLTALRRSLGAPHLQPGAAAAGLTAEAGRRGADWLTVGLAPLKLFSLYQLP